MISESDGPGERMNEWCEVPVLNEADTRALFDSVASEARELLSSGDLSEDELAYISKVSLAACDNVQGVSHERLEKIRRLCQLWEVRLRPAKISSHRPVIGPVIVAAKRMVFRILQVLLKDSFRQQRDFNAATISLLTELSAESGKCTRNQSNNPSDS